MQLRKITAKGATGNFQIGEREIFIVSWNNGSQPDFFAFDSSKVLRQVDKDYYAMAMFGNQYKKLEEQLLANIESYQSTKDEKGNVYFCSYQEGIILGFDRQADKFLEWGADEIGQGHPIYDIKYQFPNYLWLAFPTGQTVTQVSISGKKEIFKIGEYTWEDKYEPLNYPESLFVSEKYLYIPNMGSRKLFRLELSKKKLELLETFEESIWQYAETAIGKFMVTDSGLYEIEA